MKNLKIIIISLGVVSLLNIVLTVSLFVAIFSPSRQPNQIIDPQTQQENTGTGQEPEIVEFTPQNTVFGILESIDENIITVSRNDYDEEIRYRVTVSQGTIITDSIRTELDILKEAPQFRLDEIPLGSVITVPCDTIEGSECTTSTVVQFSRQTAP